MPKSQMLHDSAAHRPAAQVDLLQAQRIEKAHHRLGLVGNRIGEVRRLLAAAVAGQIRHINAETGLGEIGRQVAPVFGVTT